MSMYSIGLSGVLANQAALNVTASNTANATNANYSRQVAEMQSVVSGDALAGVNIDSIRRISDYGLSSQVRIGVETYSKASTLNAGLSSIENLLGIESLNISEGMSHLLSAFSASSVNPESTVYRTQIMTAAKDISERFNTLSNQLNDQVSAAVEQQKATVNNANGLIASISDLNDQIKQANASGQSTNTLMDALDSEMKSLSEVLDFNVLNKPDGTVELSTNSGAPLISGHAYGQLYSGYYTGDANDISIGIQFQGQSFNASNKLGGVLGANIELVNDNINPTLDHLDGMAEALADTINDALLSGLDLNGNDGVALFKYDADSPANSLSVTDITTNEIALASKPTGYNPATDSELWVGNGDIATLISGLATKKVDVNGTNTTLFDSYSELVGTVGLKVKQSDSMMTSAYDQLNQSEIAKSNYSGVNSDEEAVNLITYMNAYQANMKVISTAKDMFSSVINAF